VSGCGCGSTDASDFPAVPGAPIVCTIERGGMERRTAEFRAAFEQLLGAERFADGFRWTFRKREGFEGCVRDLAAREHECCQFLTFTISSDSERVFWETRGPVEAQGAIDVFFGLPESVRGEMADLKRAAEAGGLRFAHDGEANNADAAPDGCGC
jgi:hypothetical protein